MGNINISEAYNMSWYSTYLQQRGTCIDWFTEY